MISRFARHALIPGWSQEHLASATVVIIGVGAIGNECARVLAMSGIGRFILCDPDRVDETNLSRTPLFRTQDVGRQKVEAAAEALSDLAPGVRIETRPEPLVRGVGLAELRDASIVLGCLDSRAARLQLAGRCRLVRAPSIDGGTHAWGGEVRPYLDPDGPCYGCGLTEADRSQSDVPWSCMDATPTLAQGASAPFSAVVGAWMAGIAIRFILDLPCPKGAMSIDGSRGTTTIVRLERDPACPLHRPIPQTRVVPVASYDRVADLRSALGEDARLIAWERVQRGVECPSCGFGQTRWGVSAPAKCPQCGQGLRLRTTLSLDEAPKELRLLDLGVAPKEILYVGRSADGWIELSG